MPQYVEKFQHILFSFEDTKSLKESVKGLTYIPRGSSKNKFFINTSG